MLTWLNGTVCIQRYYMGSFVLHVVRIHVYDVLYDTEINISQCSWATKVQQFVIHEASRQPS